MRDILKKNSKQKSPGKRRPLETGFTLTETIATVSIIASIGAVAVPSFYKQYQGSCQQQPRNTIAAVMAQTQAFNDEFGFPASSWEDLDKVGTLMSSTGAATANNFNWIELPGCDYKLRADQTGNKYTFEAIEAKALIDIQPPPEPPIDESKNAYNVIGCLNVATGASTILAGDGNMPASKSDLTCN